jgi:cell division control protein 24
MVSKDKPATTIKGKPRLQLKGRIYMANVTDIVCLQKPGMSIFSLPLGIWPPQF